MNKRILATFISVVAVFSVLFGFAGTADAATVITQGTGWKTLPHISKIDKNATYYVTFDDTVSRTKLKSYAQIYASELHKYTGVKVVVTNTIEKIVSTDAPVYHHWVLDYKYRPNGAYGTSITAPWYANGYSWGGYSWIDSEYWTWNLAKYRIANIVSHEGGHMIGMDHPNYKDNSGKIISYGCAKWGSPARYPIMCSPNGGYQSNTNGGKFTHYDQIGLKQMVKNAG